MGPAEYETHTEFLWRNVFEIGHLIERERERNIRSICVRIIRFPRTGDDQKWLKVVHNRRILY